MEELLDALLRECQPYTAHGKVATYIPELAKGDPSDPGDLRPAQRWTALPGRLLSQALYIQSVVKPILLLLALLDNGEEVVRAKVGVEATGKPFDAINVTDSPLLSAHLNPMVNMGAIAICTLIHGSSYEERFQRLLNFTRQLAGNPEIDLDEAVYLSEKRTGSKNRALAFLLKSYGMLEDGVEEVLDCYFKACSIRVNSKDLANIAFVLANHGKALQSDEQLFPPEYARYVNAIMMTCGMYDGSGDFAIRWHPAKAAWAAVSWGSSQPGWAWASLLRPWMKRATAWPASRSWSACPEECI